MRFGILKLGDVSFELYELGELGLGLKSIVILKSSELGQVSFVILKLTELGEVSFIECWSYVGGVSIGVLEFGDVNYEL